MRGNWEQYIRNTDADPASIQLNTSIYLDVEEIEVTYPNVVFVQLKLKEPTEKGLLSQDEEADILEIEKNLEAFLIESNSGTYVGRIISAGNLRFLYYLESSHKFRNVFNLYPRED